MATKVVNGERIEMTEAEVQELDSVRAVSLEEGKEKKIKHLKAYTTNKINTLYSPFKQRNIIGRLDGYNDEDFAGMQTFITEAINNCNTLEEQINNASTKEEMEAIDINF